jgi:hypothetical protein
MIKQSDADKIGMIKQKIAFTANLEMDDVSVFPRRTRQIAKRITVKCRVSQPWPFRSARFHGRKHRLPPKAE